MLRGQVLADDLTGNGRIDLLLSTMNGNVYCFETSTLFTPLRAWRSHANGRNVFSPRETFAGIAIITEGGRHAPLSIAGTDFPLSFTVSDGRSPPLAAAGSRRYRVQVRVGGLVLHNETYTQPGAKHIVVPCPRQRASGVLTVTMLNEHGQYFEDRIAISFNEGFREVIKWVALLPYVVTAVIVVAGTLETRSALPL